MKFRPSIVNRFTLPDLVEEINMAFTLGLLPLELLSTPIKTYDSDLTSDWFEISPDSYVYSGCDLAEVDGDTGDVYFYEGMVDQILCHLCFVGRIERGIYKLDL